jgi:excisionase family DNA binding protein
MPAAQQIHDADAFVSFAGASDILGVTRGAVRQRVQRGQLPGKKINGSWVFLRSDVEALAQRIANLKLVKKHAAISEDEDSIDPEDISRRRIVKRLDELDKDAEEHWDSLVGRFLVSQNNQPQSEVVARLDKIIELLASIMQDRNESAPTINRVDKSEWMTVAEAALCLKMHKRTIFNMCHGGRLKAKKFGGQWRIERSELIQCD